MPVAPPPTPDPGTRADRRGLDREIFALAVPAFATLVSEPLLIIVDTAVVGHLGTSSLAGLGAAASVLGVVVSLSIFLAYGTTATVARRLGAGDLRGALSGGLDGLSLALLIGAVGAGGLVLLAGRLVGLYSDDPTVVAQGTTYLRVVALALPSILVVLAATGVLRGLQDTRTPLYVAVATNVVNMGLSIGLVHGAGLGIVGAATGTVLAQTAGALYLARTVLRGAHRQGVRWRWHPAGVLAAVRTGVWLVLRTAGMQATILTTTVVAASLGVLSLASHQVVNSLWVLLAFALDAIAIAAQAIVGRYLGAGQVALVRSLMGRMVMWGVLAGVLFGAVVWASSPLYVPLFSPDPEVQRLVGEVLLVVALITPLSGVVFVLDGVLIGAGDARYLGLASLVTTVVYVPLALLVGWSGAGLVWLWAAYSVWMLARAVTLVLRSRGTRWMRVGA
ncbi:MATE family efflux transporter [Auraticoccus monumenti]|uniref:Putative efflux protein, MATE family n=1 Tax=Auraticoccus monumenti TaxID=675864 RepID=A0A1G6SU56_9ACTN|nr:MATE family efflux transporter [Auraticoccus monumenti]SDD20308.1 putative efflux protein, MATE family [Auraticoccus monumenti]